MPIKGFQSQQQYIHIPSTLKVQFHLKRSDLVKNFSTADQPHTTELNVWDYNALAHLHKYNVNKNNTKIEDIN